MKFVLQALLIFAFSASADWLSVRWQNAREKDMPLRGAFLAVLIGLVGWLSVIWIVADSYWLMVPDLLGGAVGSYFGIRLVNRPLTITPGGIIIQTLNSARDRINPEEKD